MEKLKKYGVAAREYTTAEEARGDTYTKLDGSFPTTNLGCEENPFIAELQAAKFILDLGCGVGRNLAWIIENTSAVYIGLDPNTYMTDYFWEVQKERGYSKEDLEGRVFIYNDFEQIPDTVKFDYVVSTFVLQHLGYRFSVEGGLDITGITESVKARCNEEAVWFALEHDSEEDWIPRWTIECNITFETYIRTYKGLPELTDRDYLTNHHAGHHLMIFKIVK